jgi:hypothetical protein
MTSVISSAYLESPSDFDVFALVNYRQHTIMIAADTTNCLDSEDRLLSGRSSVQLRPGAPNNHAPVCNSRVLSVIPEAS